MPARSLKFRLILAAGALCAVFAGAALTRQANAVDAAAYPAASLQTPADPASLVARGKYLVDAADCMPCHSGPNHAPFSGGLVINTPFGGLASPNITADKTTGIGNWTDQQFYNAIHYGIGPGRADLIFPNFIYPAMPYTSYTKLSRQDVMAIKAYLFSLPPVNVAPTPNTMGFPFNQRASLLGWDILFFRPGPMHVEASWDDHMKNGAYLTEALGHCGECHTPRNLISGLKSGDSLAGAPIDSYFAPNISSDKTYGVGGWSQDDLVAYLARDGNMVKGSAFGPMAEVVKYSLSQIPPGDVQDIATYLQTATPARNTPPTAAAADAPASQAQGAMVYAANCQGCHGKTGGGLGTIIPNLAHNDAVMAQYPTNVIGAVLNGLAPWRVGPAMPAFATAMSDQQIAGVTNYVRTAFGNHATPDATPNDVMRLRAVAIVPAMADMQSDRFGCPHATAAGGATDVTDPGQGMLNIYDGATPETLPNRTRSLITAIRAANSSISPADLTNELVAAYCPVIANTPGLSTTAKRTALTAFITAAAPLVGP
jgi:mono/diheme cytochrome c family protein